MKFDRCLSLAIDSIHVKLDTAKQMPPSYKRTKRIYRLLRRLRSLERRIPCQ